jgi:putative ubiquitin-RnfH superfamily antitoxin RatB of RatAB toxin-antitoxin module
MARLEVEVVYALVDGEDWVRVSVAPGATLLDAVLASGIPARHPELEEAALRLGIHGTLRTAGTPVAAGDRIEIYRPLKVDPNEARRKRARKRR